MATMQQTNGTALVARPLDAGFVPLWQAMDSLFENAFLTPSFFGGVRPWTYQAGTNLYETGDSYIVQLAMPGMTSELIDCTIEQGTLTCGGEAAIAAPEGAAAVWQSFGGPASYRIALPDEVEADQAQASYQDGVLTITVPKAAQARVKKVPLITGASQS